MKLGGNTFPLSSIYCKITFEVFSILHFPSFSPYLSHFFCCNLNGKLPDVWLMLEVLRICII